MFGSLSKAMTTMRMFRTFALLLSVTLFLTGCPLAGQKDSTAESSSPAPTPATKDEPAKDELDIYWGDQERVKDSDYFRRRVFIDGHEVYFSGSYKNPEGKRQHIAEVTRHILSRLRMLLKDPKSFDVKPCLDPKKDVLLCLLQNIFGFGSYTVTRVLLNVVSVEILPENSEVWQPVVHFGASGQIIDLMGLSQGAFLELGTFNITPGSYSRMRLNLGTGSKIEVDEGHGRVIKPLATSSGSQEYVDLVSAFAIESSGLTTLTIDFDVADSIKRKFNGTYWIKPNLKITAVSTNSSISKVIRADQGGVIGIFGEILLSIPAGALDADTEVRLTPVFRLSPHTTPNLMTIGREYILSPADIVFNTPATLSVGFDQRYISSVGLKQETLDIFVASASGRQWASAAGGSTKDGTLLTSFLNQTGRVVVGAVPETEWAANGSGCDAYSEQVQILGVQNGLDLQYFAQACNHHRSCYEHGYRTYLKEADRCDDDLAAETMQRCENLCEGAGLFGKACKLVTPEEFAQAHADGFSAGLYETCKALASNVATEARLKKSERFPGNDQSTCLDYDGRGVSCAPASCSISADKPAIQAGIPSDITFTIQVSGSIFAADFDSTAIYRHEGYATPINKTLVVTETGRVLSEPRVFTAAISGPGGVVSCQTQVKVIETPKPCTLAIAPSTVSPGQLAGITVVAGLGYDTAYLDVIQEGVPQLVALQAAAANGTRTFFTNTRQRSTRAFTAKVVNGAGETHTCSGVLTVVP